MNLANNRPSLVPNANVFVNESVMVILTRNHCRSILGVRTRPSGIIFRISASTLAGGVPVLVFSKFIRWTCGVGKREGYKLDVVRLDGL